MNEGKVFERDFKDSAPKGVFIERFPDPIARTADGAYAFGAKNPYDFMLFADPKLYLLELKTTQGTSVSFAGENPMIKQHQIKALLDRDHYQNVFPGFLLNFRQTHATFFIPISSFIQFAGDTNRKSINEKTADDIGIYLPSWVVRTRLHYDLRPLL